MQPIHSLIMPWCHGLEGKRGVKSSLVVNRWWAEDLYMKEISCFLSAFCDSCVDSELGVPRLLFSTHTTAYVWRLCLQVLGFARAAPVARLAGAPEESCRVRPGTTRPVLMWYDIAQAQTCVALMSNFCWERAEDLWRGMRKKRVRVGCPVKESIEVPLGVSPLTKGKFPRASAGTVMGWDRVWKEGDQLLHCREMPTDSTFTRAAWDSRVAELELASQHRTKQLQVTLVPGSSWLEGIRELNPLSSFLSICNTHLRTPKLGQGWAKLNSSWWDHITFPIGMYTLKKYIGLDNIITEGKSFLVPTYTFISSSLASCLESFHLLIFMKSHPYLGTCKDTLGTNVADGHKDSYPRREALVKPYFQLLSLPPAVSVAGPGYSSKTCTCAFLPQTSILYQRQNIH